MSIYIRVEEPTLNYIAERYEKSAKDDTFERYLEAYLAVVEYQMGYKRNRLGKRNREVKHIKRR